MILITRPGAEAKKLKNILEDLGHTAHIDSLSQISFPTKKKNFITVGIFLISSQQAVKTFIKNYSGTKDLPLLVVGNVSFQKLTDVGYSNILLKAKDSNQILKYLKKDFSKLKKKYGNNIIYLTGSVTNKKLIDDLKEIGYSCEKKVIYKTVFKKSFNRTTISLFKTNKIRICLLYSLQNAQHFCRLVRNKKLSKKCKKLKILTISKNIAELMRKNGYLNVKSARYPSQKSLLNLLGRI